MPQKSYSLFIGRFQPFHLGHLQDIKDIISNGEKALIVVGSSNLPISSENPLTSSERIKLIKTTLSEEGISPKNYKITELQDINNDDLWVEHCRKNLPVFNKVYTGSEHVRKLFEKDGHFPVINVNFIENISATKIRKAIRSEKQTWESLVAPSTKDQINKNYISQIKKT